MSKKRFKIIETISALTLDRFIDFVNDSKSKKLEILICSKGGEGEPTLGICDYMRASKKEFTTIGIGRVESAGLVIFFVGNKRFAYKNTIFMAHEGQIENNSILNFFGNNKKLKIFNEAVQQIIPFKIEKKVKYFSAEELLKMGLIDKII